VSQLEDSALQGVPGMSTEQLPATAGASVAHLLPLRGTRLPQLSTAVALALVRARRTTIGSALLVLDAVMVTVLFLGVDGRRWLPAAFGTALLLLRGSLRLYRPRLRLSWIDDLPRSVATTIVAGGIISSVAALVHQDPGATAHFVRTLMLFAVANETLRLVCMIAGRHLRRKGRLGHPTLIMGAGEVGQALGSVMVSRPELGLAAVGYIDPDPRDVIPMHGGLRVLSRDPGDLAAMINAHQVDTVVVSFALTREAQLLDTIITAHSLGCTLLIVPRMFELHQDGPDVERIGGYPVVRLRPDPTTRPTWWIKRTLDIGLAAIALVLLSPVLAVCALAILVESGRPVLFHQTRVGLDGTPFRIHKLRTLKPESEDESQTRWSIADDCRLGTVGRVLRRTSLDEVPQLWNILRGEMSFVGPRPERPGFVRTFSVEHARYWARHRVPTGLTGLAQVNGLRGNTSIADRARFDNYYIANWSVWLDIKILALTVREVVHGSGS
jgi:exopolysaccharide biosynthesis polyprenyl glycosylphosphotransferase